MQPLTFTTYDLDTSPATDEAWFSLRRDAWPCRELRGGQITTPAETGRGGCTPAAATEETAINQTAAFKSPLRQKWCILGFWNSPASLIHYVNLRSAGIIYSCPMRITSSGLQIGVYLCLWPNCRSLSQMDSTNLQLALCLYVQLYFKDSSGFEINPWHSVTKRNRK